ncbi:MAG: hypothetical protein OHK0017_06640 [Patescibacteria group bacterium]
MPALSYFNLALIGKLPIVPVKYFTPSSATTAPEEELELLELEEELELDEEELLEEPEFVFPDEDELEELLELDELELELELEELPLLSPAATFLLLLFKKA